MSSADLDKQRGVHERQGRREDGPLSTRSSLSRAIKVGLLAMLLAPVLLNVRWLLSAFGSGSRMPAFWVRNSTSSQPECFNVAGEPSFRFCEDIESIPRAHGQPPTVLISCDAGRAQWNTVMGPLTDPLPRGRLFTYTYPTSPISPRAGAVPVALLDFPPNSTFHPLGLSVHPTSTGLLLFVVNHRADSSSVELFHLSPPSEERRSWEARWQRSIVHPLATHTPNAVHALDGTSFVVTNDHLFARRPGPRGTHLVPLLRQVLPRWMPSWLVGGLARGLSVRWVAARLAQLETLLGLPLSWVCHVHFDVDGDEAEGVQARIIAHNIPFANGLAVISDTLVVASTTHPGVFMYDIDPWWSPLRLREKLHLPFRPDNLALSRTAEGQEMLLATGHPAPFQLMAMARDPTGRTSSSWSVVLRPARGKEGEDDAPLPAHRVSLSNSKEWSVRTMFQATGETVVLGQGEGVALASSASSFYHAHEEGGSGTLMVSGLYDGVLACTNVTS